MERYHADVLPTLALHPFCGSGTLSVGTIVGGVGVNTVPDHCTIQINRRLVPEEDPQVAQQHLIDYLATAAPELGLVHDPPFMAGLPLSDSANAVLGEQLATIVRQVAGHCSLEGAAYATDAAFLAAAGVPTVVFGPGSIAQAHTDDEWIAVDQVQAATAVFRRVGTVWPSDLP